MSGASVTPTADQRKRLEGWRWSTFTVCLVGYIAYYLGRKNLPAAFPLLSEELGYSNTDLGLIAAYSEVAYAVGKLINGPLADRVGGRRIFMVGMAGTIVFNLVFSQMNELWGFIIAWCACRYFLSMGWGGLAKTIGHWFESRRNGTVMGWISISFQFGGVVSTLLAGAIVAAGFGWRYVFIIPAALIALMFVWAWLGSRSKPQDVIPGVVFGGNDVSDGGAKPELDDGDEETEGRPLQIIARLWRIPLFRHILVFSFLTTFLRSIFFFWTAKFLADIGMDDTSAILNSALFPFLGAIGTILLGWYTDRYAKGGDRGRAMWIMLTGLSVSIFAITALIPNAESSQGVIVVLLGAAGFFLLGPYSMSSGALTLDIAGAKGAGSCTGMIDGVGYVGGALASFGAGYLSDRLGWGGVFMVIGGASVLSTLSAYFISRDFQQRARAKNTAAS